MIRAACGFCSSFVATKGDNQSWLNPVKRGFLLDTHSGNLSYSSFLWTNRRWLAGGLLITLCSSFGQTYFISLFSSNIREDFSLTHGEFGQLYMLATLASSFTLLWLGKTLDHFRIAIVAACVFTGLASFCLAMGKVNSVPGLLIVLYGLRLFGQGMMTHTAMTAMGKWYVAARGRAVATTGMGYHIGEGIMPGIIVYALTVVTWQSLWLAGSALLLLLVPIIFSLFSKERQPGSEEQKQADAGHQWSRKEVLRDSAFWILCLGVLAPSFIGTSHFFHLIHITEYKQWTTNWAASSFILLAVMTITWTLIAGWLVDRFSARHLLPYFLVPLGLSCLALAASDHPYVLFLFMGLLGISYGISSSLFGALWPEIYGTKHLGSIRAMAVAAMVLASALGPGITGTLIDVGFDYNSQLWIMALYALVCALIMRSVSKTLLARAD